jgi:CxxC motif-containing protein (DUF1111 family)
VPGFPQAVSPWKPDYKAPGLDLTATECDALLEFVASLPAPARSALENADEKAGQKLFERIGCTDCHRPKLGNVEGIYSDLLLHDMGEALSDQGRYGQAIVPSEGS